MTHHAVSSADKIDCTKPLTFLMDPPKTTGEGEPPKKRSRKSKASSERTLTSKNFGSVLDVAKLKKANRLVIGWRMRHHIINDRMYGSYFMRLDVFSKNALGSQLFTFFRG